MAVGQAGRLLQLVNRLRRVAQPAARVTSSATRATGAGAKVTGAATKGAQATAAATKTTPLIPRNPLVGYAQVAKGLGKMATSPVGAYIGTGGLILGGGGLAIKGGTDVFGPSVASAMKGDGFVVGADGTARDAIADGSLTIRNGQDTLTQFDLASQVRAKFGLGPTKAQVVERGQQLLNTQFGQLTDAQYLKNNTTDGFQLQAGFLQRKPGETQAQYEGRLAPEVARLKRFKTAQGNPDLAGKLTGNETIAQMDQMASRAADQRFDSPLQIALRNEAAQLRQEQQRIDQMALTNKQTDYQFRIQQARLDHESKNAERNRQQTLQFKIFDRQDARAERAERSELRDRQDRRAAIASMTKGLAQLGYAFAM